MTNQIAFVLGALILIAVVVSALLAGSDNFVFLGKKLFELIEWIAFWR
ncbi:hypothetical protein ACXYMO_02950 [Arenibacterium sp. CAU 1754]